MRAFTPLVAATLACLALPADAAAFHDLDSIDGEVAAFARADIGQPGGARTPVDRKLRLKACAAALDLSWYGGRDRDAEAVLVRCPDADGWRIFVPVSTQTRGGREAVANVVERSDLVRVEAGGAGFTVMRSGEAMEDGAPGDWIRVRMSDQRRARTIVNGQVQADGRVRVPIR